MTKLEVDLGGLVGTKLKEDRTGVVWMEGGRGMGHIRGVPGAIPTRGN